MSNSEDEFATFEDVTKTHLSLSDTEDVSKVHIRRKKPESPEPSDDEAGEESEEEPEQDDDSTSLADSDEEDEDESGSEKMDVDTDDESDDKSEDKESSEEESEPEQPSMAEEQARLNVVRFFNKLRSRMNPDIETINKALSAETAPNTAFAKSLCYPKEAIIFVLYMTYRSMANPDMQYLKDIREVMKTDKGLRDSLVQASGASSLLKNMFKELGVAVSQSPKQKGNIMESVNAFLPESSVVVHKVADGEESVSSLSGKKIPAGQGFVVTFVRNQDAAAKTGN